MIVSLSANLRYTIKGGELVRLQEELDYVDRYILLQKTRLGGRLEVTKKINPKVNLAVIPKISIQIFGRKCHYTRNAGERSCSSHYHPGMYGK